MSHLVVSSLAISWPGWSGGFSFAVERGEWIGVLGHSGAGKSTLLQALAGFIPARAGSIRLDGADIGRLPPSRRGLGFVFQKDTLFPHLSLQQNLLLALHDVAGTRRGKLARVGEALDALRLPAAYLAKYPRELSGGENARANLCRALLRPAHLLLLDEPFAALDEPLRLQLNALVQEIHRARGLTTLCVTHHQEDALLFSDRILLVHQGHVECVTSPDRLVEQPPTAAAADFVRGGALVTLPDGRTFHVRERDLTLSRAAAERFARPVVIPLQRHVHRQLGRLHLILDLEARCVYRLESPDPFVGFLAFDAAQALTLPSPDLPAPVP